MHRIAPLSLVIGMFLGGMGATEEPSQGGGPASLESTHGSAQSALRETLERTPPSDREHHDHVILQIHVQTALREARRLIAAEQYERAIACLEPMLPYADGSSTFLDALAAAYRGRIRALIHQANQDQVRLLLARLRLLEAGGDSQSIEEAPHAGQTSSGREADRNSQPNGDATASAPAETPVPRAPASKTRPADDPKAGADPSKTSIASVFGGTLRNLGDRVRESTKSLLPGSGRATETAVQIAAKPAEAPARRRDLHVADRLYEQGEYVAARTHYEKAQSAGQTLSDEQCARFGYCLGFVAYQQYEELRRRPTGSVTADEWTGLEPIFQRAAALRPNAQFRAWVDDAVKQVLEQKRWSGVGLASTAPASAQHYTGWATQRTAPRGLAGLLRTGQTIGGWQTLESDNFVVYHRNRALAETVAQIAEEHRRFSHEYWFGNEPLENWSPKCTIVIYPTAQEYTQATGVPAQSPGHSRFSNDGGRITSRRLELRADDPTMTTAVLPHEITHVVLAGRFGSFNVPRWADEGMAVLTEPQAQQQAHLANLRSVRQSGQPLSPRYIMTMADYPPGGQLREFYAHSVGICRYLVEVGGPQKLVEFLRTAFQTNSYEAALQRVYGFANFAAMEADFDRHLAALGHSSPVAAARLP